jgi:hypothetical protein
MILVHQIEKCLVYGLEFLFLNSFFDFLFSQLGHSIFDGLFAGFLGSKLVTFISFTLWVEGQMTFFKSISDQIYGLVEKTRVTLLE